MDRKLPFHRFQLTLEQIAKYAFFGTIILAPVRWRLTLLERPDGTVYGDYTNFLLFIPDITLIITLLAWGGSKWITRSLIKLGPAYLWFPLAGLTLTGLFSAIPSVDSALSLYHAVRFVLLFLFYLYIVNEGISILSIGLAVGLQGLIQSIVAIGQSVAQRSIGLQEFGEYLLDPAWSGVSIVSDGATRFLRAYGLSDHPNILGGCLAFGLMVLLVLYLVQAGTGKVLIGGLFALMALALLLTFSRAAWLAFAAASSLVVILEAKAGRKANLKSMIPLGAAISLLLIPFIIVNWNYFGARLNAGQSFEALRAEAQSMDERAFLNETGNRLFVKYPLTGVGLSASPVAMKNGYPEFPTFYQPPHFALLTAALETGLFGALFYFLLLTLPWLALLRQRQDWTNPIVIGSSALLLAVTVVGFFDYYTWFSTPGRLWQWLAWGLFAVAMESQFLLRAERTLSGDEVEVEAGEGELI
ncbi:MAG TPA: O-antigen ligase family protein [Anaerolineales bacterium]|nr:O-antigen ligase family protein [Anaerolineales bacterium]